VKRRLTGLSDLVMLPIEHGIEKHAGELIFSQLANFENYGVLFASRKRVPMIDYPSGAGGHLALYGVLHVFLDGVIERYAKRSQEDRQNEHIPESEPKFDSAVIDIYAHIIRHLS
jgi:hypothetical protein